MSMLAISDMRYSSRQHARRAGDGDVPRSVKDLARPSSLQGPGEISTLHDAAEVMAAHTGTSLSLLDSIN
eukprot:3215882-Amphidinium_carterae.3